MNEWEDLTIDEKDCVPGVGFFDNTAELPRCEHCGGVLPSCYKIYNRTDKDMDISFRACTCPNEALPSPPKGGSI